MMKRHDDHYAVIKLFSSLRRRYLMIKLLSSRSVTLCDDVGERIYRNLYAFIAFKGILLSLLAIIEIFYQLFPRDDTHYRKKFRVCILVDKVKVPFLPQ